MASEGRAQRVGAFGLLLWLAAAGPLWAAEPGAAATGGSSTEAEEEPRSAGSEQPAPEEAPAHEPGDETEARARRDELKKDLARGWAALQEGRLPEAAQLFERVHADPFGRSLPSVYFGLSSLADARANGLAAYVWLHRGLRALSQNPSISAEDRSFWSHRMGQKLRWYDDHFTAVHLELPPGGRPLAPFGVQAPADRVLRTFHGSVERLVSEAHVEGKEEVWLLLPNGVYQTGSGQTVLATQGAAAQGARRWSLVVDPVPVEPLPDLDLEGRRLEASNFEPPDLPLLVVRELEGPDASTALVAQADPQGPGRASPYTNHLVRYGRVGRVSRELSDWGFSDNFSIHYAATAYSEVGEHAWVFVDAGFEVRVGAGRLLLRTASGARLEEDLSGVWRVGEQRRNIVELELDGGTLGLSVNGEKFGPFQVWDGGRSLGRWRVLLPFGEVVLHHLWVEPLRPS